MGLEFLCWPQMALFFGERAERYRRTHLTEALLFLPYAAAVDHFQHWVYETPRATPDERRQRWRELEREYLPWRRYRDLAYPARGGFWQLQRHLYIYPFYYIDYALALCCALQLWGRAQEDPARAMADYIALCDKGGTLPFQGLLRSASLTSPLQPDGVLQIITPVQQTLGLQASRCSLSPSC
jgi:M3 family oligoendopeptidase